MSHNEQIKKVFGKTLHGVLVQDWDVYRSGRLHSKFFYDEKVLTPAHLENFIKWMKGYPMDPQLMNECKRVFQTFDCIESMDKKTMSQIKAICLSFGFMFVLY